MEASSKSSAAQLLVFLVIVAGSLFINFAPVTKLVVRQHYPFPNASLQVASVVRQSNFNFTYLPKQTNFEAPGSKSQPNLQLNPPSKITRTDCTNFGRLKNLSTSKMTVASVSEKLNLTLSSPFIKKTVFQGPRAVFFAGLEGTGHHLVDSSLKETCTHFDYPSKTRCRSSSALHSVIGQCTPKWNFDKLRTPGESAAFFAG